MIRFYLSGFKQKWGLRSYIPIIEIDAQSHDCQDNHLALIFSLVCFALVTF